MCSASSCFYCQAPSSSQCSCGAWYCGMDHLLIHRPGQYCLPFHVSQAAAVGRCLVASRDISPLELVLWDRAAVVGPPADCTPVCLQCLAPVDGSFPCPDCWFPLCGWQCAGGARHKEECAIFKELHRKPCFDNFKEKAPIYATIAPLRLLLLKKKDPLLWARICSLMDHNEERFRSDPDMATMFQMIVKFFLEECQLDFTSQEEIEHVVGVLMTNGFENDNNGRPGRAIYPSLSLISHSCQANLRHAVSPGTQVALQAQRPIKAGEELTIRYTHMLQGHLKRRKQIEDVWFFQCRCPRCSDPTEFGSNASAIVCPICNKGSSLPLSSLDADSMWICAQCGGRTPPGYITELEEKVDKELEDVRELHTEGYQGLLKKYKDLLAPSHYLMVIIKRYIHTVGMGKQRLTEVPLVVLEDRAKFCRSFLRYLGKLDPGCSQHIALTSLELSKVDMELARRNAEEGLMGKEDFMELVRENMALQGQANKWLQSIKIAGII